MVDRIINREISVIPALDVDTEEQMVDLVAATRDVEGIGGYKLGLQLGSVHGLKNLVPMMKDLSGLPIIYDGQKLSTDIPDMGAPLMKAYKKTGVDAVILFPQSGPATGEAWIKAAQDAGLGVWVGTHMTHPKFLQSEGGYLSDDFPERAFGLAMDLGVNHFIVPGNKVEAVERYVGMFTQRLGEGNFTVAAPGFITQKGEISEFAKVAGKSWHAIVGSGIYKAPDMHAAAELVTAQIR